MEDQISFLSLFFINFYRRMGLLTNVELRKFSVDGIVIEDDNVEELANTEDLEDVEQRVVLSSDSIVTVQPAKRQQCMRNSSTLEVPMMVNMQPLMRRMDSTGKPSYGVWALQKIQAR